MPSITRTNGTYGWVCIRISFVKEKTKAITANIVLSNIFFLWVKRPKSF